MANISPIKKNGEITGYRIRVYHYTDGAGKKHFYSKNWTIPASYKSDRAINQALMKEVSEFEASCGRGDVSSESRTLIEYCRYYIATKDLKPASKRFYESLLPFIEPEIGYVKLKNLVPEHLDKLYKKLLTSDVRLDGKATALPRCIELLSKRTETLKVLTPKIGIGEGAYREALKGNPVSKETAQKIAAYYGKPVKDLFTISSSSVGLAPKTVRHVHSFLYSVLEFAVKKGAINVNVATRATPPKNKPHEAEFFELSEILKIKSALEKEPLKYKLATLLLIDTGCRRGELLGLRWDVIDFQRATVKIERNVQFIQGRGMTVGTPKGGKARTVSIAPQLLPLLAEYKKDQETATKIRFSSIESAIERHRQIKAFNPEGYIFIQENGQIMTPSALNQWMNHFSDRVGMHVHPHKFRHSSASLLIGNNVDILTISKRLGHAQVSTTQNIYAHLLEDSDRKASDALSALIFSEAL